MSDWSHGYNVSQGYTYGAYRELSPEWLDLAATLNGYVAPAREGDRFRYLELGCGQGFGLCQLAAAYPQAEFVGVDFNPEHVAHGIQLARSAGIANVRFIEADFADLAAAWPADLGRFEYVALHGIIAWVPVAIRQALVRCLDAACNPGALVYVSYNSLPGWLGGTPLQHILQYLNRAGGRASQQIFADGIGLLQGLLAEGAAVGTALPSLPLRMESIKTQQPAYLVQEYLHDEWHPLWFSTVAQELAGAKLGHVGTATLSEALLPAILPPGLRAKVAVEDPVLRQDLIALAINQGFRRDVFCRGPRRQPAGQDAMAGRTLRRLKDMGRADLPITTGYATIPVTAATVAMFDDVLADGSATVSAVLDRAKANNHAPSDIAGAIALLLHAGYLAIERDGAHDWSAVQRLNALVVESGVSGGPYADLMLPRIGHSMRLHDTDMMLLDAYNRAQSDDAEALGQALEEGLARSGRQLNIKDRVATREEQGPLAKAIAADFLDKRVSLWRSLGAVA